MENEQPVTRLELHAEMAAFKDELMATMRQIETNLLTAFHGYSRASAARLHDVENGEHDLRLRVAALEDRMLAIETRRPL